MCSWLLPDIKKGISHYAICTQHGRENFAGRRQGDCLSRFSVHLFRLGISKQNSVGFHMLRDALHWHPCRVGLNRASMHGFP